MDATIVTLNCHQISHLRPDLERHIALTPSTAQSPVVGGRTTTYRRRWVSADSTVKASSEALGRESVERWRLHINGDIKRSFRCGRCRRWRGIQGPQERSLKPGYHLRCVSPLAGYPNPVVAGGRLSDAKRPFHSVGVVAHPHSAYLTNYKSRGHADTRVATERTRDQGSRGCHES